MPTRRSRSQNITIPSICPCSIGATSLSWTQLHVRTRTPLSSNWLRMPLPTLMTWRCICLQQAHRNFVETTKAHVWHVQMESSATKGTMVRWPWLTLTTGHPLVWHLQQLCGIVRELTVINTCVKATVQICKLKNRVAPGLCFWTLTAKRQHVELQPKSGFHACFAWKLDGEDLLTVW